MKHQYFGDQNDYVKYGLLRILSKSFRIGVAWMLTPPDGKSDGSRTSYLKNVDEWRHYDVCLYDALERIIVRLGRRDVGLAQDEDLIRSAAYFEEPLSDVTAERGDYFGRLAQALRGCDLVFFDPDNGMEIPSKPRGKHRKKDSSKYLYWDELTSFVKSGSSALVYQHFPREKRSVFVPRIIDDIAEKTGVHSVVPLLTKHVAFFLAIRADHSRRITPLIEAVFSRWDPHIRPFNEDLSASPDFRRYGNCAVRPKTQIADDFS